MWQGSCLRIWYHSAAITFFLGLNFVYQLLDMFDHAELSLAVSISFPRPWIRLLLIKINWSSECAVIKWKMNDLLARMDKGRSSVLYIPRYGFHEKLYVSVGRRQMAESALSQVRQYVLSCVRRYAAKISALLMAMKRMIGITIIVSKVCSRRKARMRSPWKRCNMQMPGENIDELPIAGTIKANKVFVIEPLRTTADDASKSNLFLDIT